MIAKRILDLGLAIGMLLFVWPLFLVMPAIVRVGLGAGPILFRQSRPGRHGKPFTVLKFRTMTDARDGAGDLLPDADRLPPAGRFLRRFSLDELPQLLNVLRGEMSFVGPRPLLMAYLPLYSPRQARRHEVPPGITGWAQVNGRNATSWEERFDLDVWYVEHRSFLLDLRILYMTIATVLSGHGVSSAESVTMTPFTGSPRRRDE